MKKEGVDNYIQGSKQNFAKEISLSASKNSQKLKTQKMAVIFDVRS